MRLPCQGGLADMAGLRRPAEMKKAISVNRSPARVKVGDIANRPLVTVKRDMSLAEASRQMAAANVRRVIVEMDGKPVGMVTDHDLFRTVEVFGWGPDA